MKKENLLYGACGALLLACGGLLWSNHRASQRIDDLQAQVDHLSDESRKSEVVKRISQQMEDIAYEQKNISDQERDKAVLLSEEAQEQRREAERQTVTANQMRRRAETERSNAVQAEKQAKESATLAEEQRRIADDQRMQAEHSKRITDTLSYVALARSLGSLSSQRYTAGDKDVASLLAYGAWYFSDRYGGDAFYPAIFNALSLSSGNKTEWIECKGGLTDLLPYKDGFVTVSNYGEVMLWQKQGDDMTHKMIFHDKEYDFRDAHLDGSMLYALSRDGTILRIDVNNPQNKYTSKFAKGNFSQIHFKDDIIASYEGSTLYLIKKDGLQLERTVKAPANIVHIDDYAGRPTIFTSQGVVYFIEKDGTLTKELSMGIGDISSFTATKKGDQLAFGTRSGMVYVMDYPKMKNIRKLRGHQSEVSKVGFVKGYLVTASYDRTLKLWDLNSEKLEPITLNTFSSWVRCFSIGNDNHIWTGDAQGALTSLDISPESMAKTIKNSLKRDFTQQEWNYYIGREVPFTSFTNKEKQ